MTTDRRNFLQTSLSGLAALASVPLLGGGLTGCQQVPSREKPAAARKTAATKKKTVAAKAKKKSAGAKAKARKK